MPVQHQRQNRTGTTPWRDLTAAPDPNFSKDQRQDLLDVPYVLTNSADLTLTAGAPGPNGTFVWQTAGNNLYNGAAGNTNIYDRFNMVGPAPTTNIRIPWDGIYDVAGSLLLRTSAAVFQVETTMMYAPTSDSGFGAPVFAAVVHPLGSFTCRWWMANPVAAVLPPRSTFLTRGLEFHANDLLQMVIQLNAAANQNVNMEWFEVRWTRPIPNNSLTVMPNHV